MRSVRTKKLEEVVDGLRLSLSEPGDHDILAEIVTGLQDLVDNLLPHLATVHVQTWARPVRRAIILLETNENQRKWKITIEKINGELNEKFINRIIATLVFIKLVAVSRPSFASGQASRIAQNWVLDQMGPNAKSEVFRSIEASLKRRRKRKNVVANTLVFGFVLLWLFWSIGGFGFSRDIYWSFFGLNESSTIQEYKYSSLKDRVRFLGNLCTKTACLEAVDLHCGFGVGDDGREFSEFQDVVESCFYAKLKTAPPDTMLGDLVLQCGRKNAQFTNVKNDVFNPTSCKENGGRWGVIKPMASN